MKKNNAVLVILYDSITNSVFESQVVEPLLRRLEHEHYSTASIVSFESDLSLEAPDIIKKNKDRLQLHLFPKKLFLGRWQLKHAAHQIRTLLHVEKKISAIIARGPLAGYIATYATKGRFDISLTIQVRGLLAEEYRYIHQNKKGLSAILHKLRAFQYETLERLVYLLPKQQSNILLEAVSPSLKDHLITRYGIHPTTIKEPFFDKPPSLSDKERKYWRSKMRKKLNIPEQAYVWCYNGSFKAWQCPDETISYFQKVAALNPEDSYLLILSGESNKWKDILQHYSINEKYVRVLSVTNDNLIHYLAASDEGIIFRQANLLNWVSRPTKMLEYRAAGLTIAHNRTIGILVKEEYPQSLPITDLPKILQEQP